MDFADYLDEEVVLYGIAENAMAGAVLRCGRNTHVYLDGLPQWDESDHHGAFEVTGVLAVEGDDTEAFGENRTTHRLGRHYVLKNPTWERCR
ncbi:hypothetical protein IU486_28240 [Streptomyces gardneri]|uniref:hypothetical protein n=1 Tax=Nocardia TaxID=1817 RepID=UPI0018956E7B|nr:MULTISPECIES: hypothetical protein [Nocardia]MBF6168609.1 hypothetical protein [Streptomyces gardneri]MBF6208842.1 hypothetical protein [Streptomyces gardneri]UAK36106.1 hypothetical protein K8O92_27090 [Nocardia asteroides]